MVDNNLDETTPESMKPVSLRDNSPREPQPPQNAKAHPLVYIIVTAVVFLMVGLLLASAFNGDSGDTITQDELRNTVQEVVGTEIANLPQGGENRLSSDQMQAMVDEIVSTQVAALVPTETPIPPTPTRVPIADSVEDDAFLGPADAPVVIVEFSDFQCGYCGRWYQSTLPQILEAYPDEVKFVYRDFPIFGDDSARAAMASECAEEQGKFWDMHNILFEGINADPPLALDEDSLVNVAGDLDMNTVDFRDCLSSERYFDEIVRDYQAASAYGFRGTPGFVINGQVQAIGAQPFEVFDSLIKQELAAQESAS